MGDRIVEGGPGADQNIFSGSSPSTPLTRPFWEAAARGQLVVQECQVCGHRQWTPQFACRNCLSESMGWLDCSGRGVVYSSTVVHRSPDPQRWPTPYVLAVVTIEEGPQLLTRVVGCSPSEVAIGMPVRVAFGDLAAGPARYEFMPA